MAGRSAVIVPFRIPGDLEAIRIAGDRMAARGVPPHVTILFPFLLVAALTPEVRSALAALAAQTPMFVARFDVVERRDESVWLLPADQQPFLDLTAGVADLWPDHPPYEGAHDHLIAHMTLVETWNMKTLDAARAAATASGPFGASAAELRVITEDEAGHWHTRWHLPLGPHGTAPTLDA